MLLLNAVNEHGCLNILFECLLSILMGICPEAELLNHGRIVFTLFEDFPYYFSQGLHHFTFPQQRT